MLDSVRLLSTRRFRPFFLTQLLGAFNDNLYKNGLTIFIAFQAANISQQQSNTLVNVAAGLFILPFFLFSPIAGQLADKYEKSMLIRRVKLLEIGIMLLGLGAFVLQSPVLLVGILFLMGTQSALFGPVKYSLLPQALRPEELVGGNAMVEVGTFLAILLGLILLSTIPTRQILMPAINDATDTGEKQRFKTLHALSIVVTLVQIVLAAVVLARFL